MKRILTIILLGFLTGVFVNAQNEQDALMISENFYGGTARSVSMGGAFGSLGGDLTVASTNPGGLAVFRTSTLTFTPTVYHSNSSSQFMGNMNEDFEYKFNVNNLGYAWVYNTGSTSGWVSTTLAFGYNRLNDYTKRVFISTDNASGSLLDEFVVNSNNGFGNEFYEDQAYNADLLFRDTITGEYFSDFSGSDYGQLMEKTIIKSGRKGEYYLSFAANYSHKLYIGGTFGIQRLRYEENTEHVEEDVDGTIPFTQSFNFREFYDIWGTGYTFKVGILARPVEMLRLGAAFHMPTLFKLNTEFSTDMRSAFDEGDPLSLQSSSRIAENDYRLITPMKIMGSIGIQVQKFALLSVDYEYLDYGNMRLRSDYDNFTDINGYIQDDYRSVGNIRAGAELRFGPLAFRGGYAIYGDPYVSNHDNSGANTTAISGGIGIRSKDFFFDLGYVYSGHDEKHFLYQNRSAFIETNTNKVLATIGLRF